MTNAELWQRMLPLALGAAVSPLLLLGQLTLLTTLGSRAAALRRSLAYLLGALLIVLIWTMAAGWIAHRLPQHQRGADPVAAAVQLMLALALGALALQILRRPAHAVVQQRSAHTGLLAPAAQGAGLMAINLTSLVLFLPAAQDVGRSGLPWDDQLIAWIGLVLITLLPIWVPPLLVVFSGRAGAQLLERLGHAVDHHRRAIDASVAAGFAVLLALRGLAEL